MSIAVLIVDDSQGARLMIERTLRLVDPKLGHCHHAANGLEALRVLQDHWVDLIITDLRMEQMDGWEFIRRVRADDVWGNIPIAVVTAECGEETGSELASLGVDVYQPKPLSPEALAGLFQSLRQAMP